MNKKFNFFKAALKNYRTSGTVAPSSRFLADKMLKHINFSEVKVIVELGPGNGAITKYILEKLNPRATLVCFEINDDFRQELLKLNHPNLKVINASAEKIGVKLNELGVFEVDCIVSSLPLSIIPKNISEKILKESYYILSKQGVFMQFQYSLNYFKTLKEIYNDDNISINFEPFNLPPAFIYKCVKNC